jgi:TATA-box binding protein (TBP) (component of TFIID and TFIIIB)
MAQEYSISTQTYVVYSNDIECVDLNRVFEEIVLTSIVTGVKYGKTIKGNSKHDSVNASNYLKCMTLALLMPEDKKALSVKVFKNGSIQVTGCKCVEHVTRSIDVIYRLIGVTDVSSLYLVSVMTNANLEIGYKINRDKLVSYFTDVCKINIPPMTNGYMGTKLRIQLMEDAANKIMIPHLKWNSVEGFTSFQPMVYADYFANCPKKRDKQFVACIGIFQNGKVLISGINEQAIDFACNWIKQTLNDAKSFVEIRYKPPKTFRR